MKFSKSDLVILNNFSSINEGVIFREGDTQRAMSVGRTIIAKAKFDLEFPRSFCVANMPQFVRIMEAFKEPSLDFREDHVRISDAASKATVDYFYSDPLNAREVANVNLSSEPVHTFEISQEMFDKVSKLSKYLSVEHLRIYSKDGKLQFGTYSQAIKSNASFEIGTTQRDFSCVFDLDNMMLLPCSYDVHIYQSPVLMAKFVAKDNYPIEYIIVANSELSRV